jgi:hypothetical protein
MLVYLGSLTFTNCMTLLLLPTQTFCLNALRVQLSYVSVKKQSCVIVWPYLAVSLPPVVVR